MNKPRPIRRSDFPKYPFKSWILDKDYQPKQITLVRVSSSFTPHLLREDEGWTHHWNDLHRTREAAIRAGHRKLNAMSEKGYVPAGTISQYRQALMRAEAESATTAH